MIIENRFFVGGEWAEPAGDGAAEILNPATGEVIGTAAVPEPADAVRAIEAARRAFDEGPWPGMPPGERAAALRRLGGILRERKRALGDLIIRETGSTLVLAKTFQCAWPIDAIPRIADWVEAFPWEEELSPQDAPPVDGLLLHEPVGVVSAITPFNYPLFVNLWKVAPAIGMGNTVVLKPAPWTPLDAFEIARAVEEAGIPPGVVNVIGGGGAAVGRALVSHPGVDMVSFTGSVPAGREVGALAAQTVKRVQLELGGKSAAVVLDDADLDEVAVGMVGGCMIHAGQGCGCTTRLLVPAALHDACVERVAGVCAALPLGDPADPGTVIGPLIREEHRRRVEAHVAGALEEGAEVACGARRPPGHERGFFYEPTVLTGVHNGMRIAREEVFGPVLAVIPYRDEEEAAAIANDSEFGLAGAIFSRDRARAVTFARRLRTGYVGMGTTAPNFNGTWGGYRQSGVGREWRGGLSDYTETKTLSWMSPPG